VGNIVLVIKIKSLKLNESAYAKGDIWSFGIKKTKKWYYRLFL